MSKNEYLSNSVAPHLESKINENLPLKNMTLNQASYTKA